MERVYNLFFKEGKNYAAEVISLLFVLIFTYTAMSKLLDFEQFRVQIGQSPLLSAFAGYVAIGIPAIEIIISLMLSISKLRLIGLYASFSLMIMFTAYIIIILNFSDFIPCSCGGVLEELEWTEHLIFNVGFILLALIGIFLLTKPDNGEGSLKTATAN